jgi:H+/Cl- antiporter ClcA
MIAQMLSVVLTFYSTVTENGSHWMPMMGSSGWASMYMTVFYVLLLLLLFGLVIYVYLWILRLWKSMSGKRQD